MDNYNKQEIDAELIFLHNHVNATFVYIRPVRLMINERRIIRLLNDLTKIKQNLETDRDFSEEKRVLSENVRRDIEYLQVQLTFNSHNFLVFSAAVSIGIAIVSLILGLISILK